MKRESYIGSIILINAAIGLSILISILGLWKLVDLISDFLVKHNPAMTWIEFIKLAAFGLVLILLVFVLPLTSKHPKK